MRLIDADKIGLTDFEITMCNGDYKEALKMLLNKIDNAPTIAQPEWIPCSERLPKENGDYLVTTHLGQIARYVFNKGSSEEYWMRCAMAWMPLPEPYTEGY